MAVTLPDVSEFQSAAGGNGFARITTVIIGPATEKVTVKLPGNCSAISFQRQDDPGNWATIAHNLGS
jgi:hypothetical protein